MRHIHTSIASRYLATRGNTKILRTPPPHISSSEERLHRLTRPTLAQQINHPSSNYTYTKLMPNHIHHHYAPSVKPTHTTHIISSTASTYTPRCHPWICGQTRRSEGTAGQMDANGKTPTTSKGQGSGWTTTITSLYFARETLNVVKETKIYSFEYKE